MNTDTSSESTPTPNDLAERIRNFRPISKEDAAAALQLVGCVDGAYFLVPLADGTLRQVPAWMDAAGQLVCSHPTEPAGHILSPDGMIYFFEDSPARSRVLGLGPHRTELDDADLWQLYQTAMDEDEREACWDELQRRRA